MYGEEDLSDDLMKKMHGYEWSVEVTMLEIPKQVWICDEHEVEF